MKIVLGLSILFAIGIKSIHAKVRILTFHFNKPECIYLQNDAFAHFMKDQYEIIVFNDAKDQGVSEKIDQVCFNLGIQCVRYEQKWHLKNPINYTMINLLGLPGMRSELYFSPYPALEEHLIQNPSVRHSHVIQFALDNYGYDHNDIVVIIDGDAFPIRPLKLSQMMQKFPVLGIKRCTEDFFDYLWVIFIAFDPRRLPNIKDLKFGLGPIDGKIRDTGSESYNYFIKNPEVKVKKILGTVSRALCDRKDSEIRCNGFSKNEISLIRSLEKPSSVEFHIHKHILHLGASSFNLCDQEHKFSCARKFLETILESSDENFGEDLSDRRIGSRKGRRTR